MPRIAIDDIRAKEWVERMLKRLHDEDAQIHRSIESYERRLEKLEKKLAK